MSAEVRRKKLLLEALVIDTEPLLEEDVQINDGDIGGDYSPILPSGSQPITIVPLIWYSRLIMSSFSDC